MPDRRRPSASAPIRRSLPRRSLRRLLRQAGVPPFLQPTVEGLFNRRCRGRSIRAALIKHPNSTRFSSSGECPWRAGKAAGGFRHRLDRRRRDGPPGGQQQGHPERRSDHCRHGFERCLRPLTHKNRKFRPGRTFLPWSGRLPNCEPG
jgi:hypothetical protein